MADSVSAAGSLQTAMVNAQLAQEVGVRVQKQAVDTQEQGMAPLIDSIGESGGQTSTAANNGPVGGQVKTYA